jgi:peptidoglycan/xylan/chitin deacetylase (PgdA/CDA1 family)
MRAILTYHSIDDSRSPISISPDQFVAHHSWFAARKVRVLPLADLLNHPAGGADAIAITFDDGFRNTLEPAAALLAEGIPVSLFIVSRHVGKTNAWRGVGDAGIPVMPLLDWDELERLRTGGAAVEGHTRTHPPLVGLSDTELDEEIGGGQADLRARFHDSSTQFAYPYGDLDDRVVARTRQFHAVACTTAFGPLEEEGDSMLLPRLDMYYFRGPGRLEAWGTARFLNRLRWIRTRRHIRRLLFAKGK